MRSTYIAYLGRVIDLHYFLTAKTSPLIHYKIFEKIPFFQKDF